jgi:hypothetical protein
MYSQSTNKKKSFKFLIAGFLILCLIVFAIKIIPARFLRKVNPFTNGDATPVKCKHCNGLFPDGVATHERAYYSEGITPRKTLADLDQLQRTGKLVRIKDGEKFYLDAMEHSAPFLLPKAAEFLDVLAQRYEEECEKRGLKYHSFKITSMTRSIESVNDLKKENTVAIKNSAHLKGKTLDISYTDFAGHQAQLDAFVTALSDLRKADKCFVKYEESTGCVHITAR